MSKTNSSWKLGYGRRISYRGTPPPLRLHWVGHWLTPYEFAAQMQRSYSWARQAESRWGILSALNISHMRDSRGRLWIQLPIDLI